MGRDKEYWKFFPYLLLFLAICVIGILVNTIKKKDVEIKIHEQNERSLNDSVRQGKNKIGELEFSKNILVGNITDLKQNNQELYNLLMKTNGKVSELTQYVISIDNRTKSSIKTDVIEYDNFRYGLKWKSDTIYNKDNSRHLAGETIFDVKFDNGKTSISPFETKITTDITNIKVSQGLRKIGNNIEVFVTSNHPNFKVSELNSVIINPEDHISKEFVKPDKKRFGLGLSVGYGVNKDGFTPYVGVGLNYNAIRF